MAAINFPNPGTQTPSNTFSPVSSPSKTLNGLTYVWNGVGWRIKPSSSSPGGASVTISDTSPGDALNGDLWWDSGTPTSLFIYYTDSNSSQWVPATPQTDSWYINGGQIVPSQSGQSVNIGTGALTAGSATFATEVVAGVRDSQGVFMTSAGSAESWNSGSRVWNLKSDGGAQFGPSTAGKVSMEGMGTTQGELIISNPTGSNSFNCFRVVGQGNNTIVFKQGGDATFSGTVTSSNVTAFKVALTSAVTASTDHASLKAAILSAIASL